MKLFAGCVRLKKLTWSPLAVHGFAVEQPHSLGGFTVLRTDCIGLQKADKQTSLVFSKTRLNLLGDAEGLLHFVALLQVLFHLLVGSRRSTAIWKQTLC